MLTERNEHLDRFASVLSASVPHVVVLRGGMGKKQRQAAAERLAAIPPDEGRVILATGKYIGEGFDDPRLDTLFLTLPVSWRGTIAQYVGRLHRLYDGKREVRVYDYADLNVPMLARMFDRRCRGYEAVGYTIILPASAIPGWPADVPLPADPVWKHDYAASVRRLIRDGVDTPLANLFVTAARPIASEAEGAKRARSATEAFLYRRLETLPETRGRFRAERRSADCVRRLRQDGSRSAVRRFARRRRARWRRSISPIRSRTAATDARISCCRRTAISCCAISPRTWARNWTRCSMGFCER